MKKDDVQTRFQGYDIDGVPRRLPCLNVKVHNYVTEQVVAAVRGELGLDAGYTLEWFDNYYEDQGRDWVFEMACQDGWETAKYDAEEVFAGRRVEVFSEGRSGGWLVVDGLPPIESWDAIMLGKWAKFARYVKGVVDDIPYQMAWLVGANAYEPAKAELDEKRALLARGYMGGH